MKWEVLGKRSKSLKGVIDTLLKNRNIKDSKDFFNPIFPEKLSLESLGIKKSSIKKCIDRIKKSKKNKEQVIIYGDYDADGICSTAILWEALHKFGLDVLPHIPDRFEEGYGINFQSVSNLKSKIPNLKLIVTVDNGIVANDGIAKTKDLGIDVIIIDHHAKGAKIPNTSFIIHNTSVCGSALAYFFAKELGYKEGLDLAAVGTIADQMSLLGVNRSIVKYGLEALSKTKRVGLRVLLNDSKITEVGTYEVNYIIAPRLNAMGRLAHGIDSLRLLCTTKLDKAQELSKLLSKTNTERQVIVETVVIKTKVEVGKNKIIVIAHESYHEGVIGLAAGKLVEEFYRPAIVISTKGEIAKASARSVSGFNIIEAIRKTELILEGGGHPMAAGFTISTSKIKEFAKKINEIANDLLTEELLEKKLKIDMEIDFGEINMELAEELKKFAPFGMGNQPPTFATNEVEILEAKPVGKDAKHLKLKLKKGDITFDGIWFGYQANLSKEDIVSAAFQIDQNTWNGYTNLQLKVKDING